MSEKSQGSLCSVVKTLILSLVRARGQGARSPIELFWTAKNDHLYIAMHCTNYEVNHDELILWLPSFINCVFEEYYSISAMTGTDSDFSQNNDLLLALT